MHFFRYHVTSVGSPAIIHVCKKFFLLHFLVEGRSFFVRLEWNYFNLMYHQGIKKSDKKLVLPATRTVAKYTSLVFGEVLRSSMANFTRFPSSKWFPTNKGIFDIGEINDSTFKRYISCINCQLKVTRPPKNHVRHHACSAQLVMCSSCFGQQNLTKSYKAGLAIY